MYKIDKQFNFEMAHRVWTQNLNTPELSGNTNNTCRYIHGHSYKLKVFLKSKKLDSNMVLDFKNLNFVKDFLDQNLDHKCMVDINDPNFTYITGISPEDPALKDARVFDNLLDLIYDYHQEDIENKFQLDSNAEEHYGSFVIVDFCPTSENICKELFNKIKDDLGSLAKLSAVELWETEKSHCRYSE